MAYGLTKVKVTGAWKALRGLFLKQNGDWTPVKTAWKKVNGKWQRVYPTPQAIITYSAGYINATAYQTETSAIQTLILTNTGDGKLILNGWTPVNPPEFSIYLSGISFPVQVDPGQSIAINAYVVGSFLGEFEPTRYGTGYIRFNCYLGELVPSTTSAIPVNGTILPLYSTCDPSTNNLSLTFNTDTTPVGAIALTNNGNKLLRINSITGPNWLTFNFTSNQVGVKASAILTATPQRTLPAGSYSGTITITHNGRNPTVTIGVTATVVASPGSATYYSSGNFTVPRGVTLVFLRLIGAGGGGGGSGGNEEDFYAGGGGGAGQVVNVPVNVSPFENVTFFVGVGGGGGGVGSGGADGGGTAFKVTGYSSIFGFKFPRYAAYANGGSGGGIPGGGAGYPSGTNGPWITGQDDYGRGGNNGTGYGYGGRGGGYNEGAERGYAGAGGGNGRLDISW